MCHGYREKDTHNAAHFPESVFVIRFTVGNGLTTMALTDDSTTSSTNSGGIAGALSALNSASTNMCVYATLTCEDAALLRVIAGATDLVAGRGWSRVDSLLSVSFFVHRSQKEFVVCNCYHSLPVLFLDAHLS